jgi:hypothetical protein
MRSGRTGGAGRDRTGDLLNANQALSQLSYSPVEGARGQPPGASGPGAGLAPIKFIEADWTRGSRQAQTPKVNSLVIEKEIPKLGPERLPSTCPLAYARGSMVPATFS